MDKIQDSRGSLWAANFIQINNGKLFYCGYRVTNIKNANNPKSKYYYSIFGGPKKDICLGEIALQDEQFKQATDFLSLKEELTQSVFWGQPDKVDWAGVDYDGLLKFGKANNPRYTWASERWRGVDIIGEPIENSNFKTLTMIYRKPVCIKGISPNLCSSIMGKDCPCMIYQKRTTNK